VSGFSRPSAVGLGPSEGPDPRSAIPDPRPVKLFLGIDGGQTGTQAVIADASGRVLGRGEGGPSNHVEAPGGRERLRGAILDSAGAALRDAHLGSIETTVFEAAYCAMTGEADFKTEIITPLLRARVLCVEHDAPAALAGGTLGEPGIIVVAGTGSVVYGENAAGQSSRTGGWGYVFGDEGSGFGLAREALRAALDSLDGVGPDTTLVPVLSRFFAVDDLRPLPMVMYNGHITRDGIAAAAREVLATWQAGDAVATRIVGDGLDALVRRVRSVAARLSMSSPRVCLSGGVFRSAAYADAFGAALRTMLPGADVRPARSTPATGAVLLALRVGGIVLDDSIRARVLDAAPEDHS
jgi:N-acetylglucosamine kinase-like BadF-type ATPase